MGSHTLDILRQGLWASLTGGWFYDPQQSTFCNTFHLYLWLFLLCLPLTIYLTVPGGFIAWAIYCGVVGILFIITKSINYALHHTFDHGEAILEDVSEEQEPTEDINQNEKQAPSHETAEQSGVNIEMVAMTSTRTEHTHTPPVLCSSRNSVQGESRRGSVRPMTPADSMEYINELIKGKDGKSSLGDLHVEIHQPDVKGSSPSKSQLHHIDAKGSSPSKAELLQPEIAVEHSLSRPDLNPANNAPVKKVSLKSLQITVLDDGEQGSSQPNLKNKDSSRSLPAQFSLAADQDKPSEPSCSHSEKLRDIRRTKSARTVSPKLKRVLFKQTSFHETSSHSDPTIAERTKADLLESLRAVNSGQSQSGVIGCNENNNNNREHNGCDATEDDTQKDKTVIGNSSKEDELSVVNPSLNLEQKDHGAEAIADSSGVSASVVVKGDFKQPSTNVVNNTGHDKAQSKSKRTKPNSSKGKRKRLKKKRQLNVPPSPTQPTAQPPHSSATQAWALNEFESDTDSLESELYRLRFILPCVCVCSNASVSTSSEENDLIEQLEVLAGEPSATANVATTVDEVDHEPGTSAEVIDKSKGAIPKRRPLPPIPQQGSRAQVDGDSPPLEVNTEELTARLLKILSKEDPSEAEEELRKLKEEMVQRKIQQQQRCEGQLESRVRLKTHRGLGLTPPSSASPSERSTLLPGTVGYSPAGGSGRRRAPRRRNSAGSRRSRHSSDRSSRPASGLVDDTLAPDKHVATSHNDTSEGAVHYFQDSRGKWFSYTFEPNSSGIANGVTPVASGKDAPWRDGRCDSSSDSDSTIVLEAPSSNRGGADVGLDNVFSFDLYNTLGSRPIRLNPLHSYMDQLLEVGRRRVGDGGDSDTDVSHNIAQLEPARPKQYYKFWYLPCLSMKVRVDRLAVLALLDRNVSLLENVLTVVLAVVVSMMGAAILSAGIFHDLWIFLYCLVIASCQYSLLKSVQPDATSPMHGYNRVVVFSRPFYFCLCCGLILLLGYARTVLTHTTVYIYGMAFTSQGALTFAQDMMIVFVLCFPLIFTIGLLPQVNTFITYVLEQLDIHMFGGTATTSLTSAVYSILKSMLAIALLYPVCFGPLWITKSVEVKVNSPAQEMPAQHVLFSVFTGLLVSLSYHLSRSSSDPTVLWDIIKRKMCRSRSKMNETSDNEELSDPLPGKLRKSVCQRLRSDLVVCFFIAIFTFAIHVSTVFTVLQPSLHDVLCYLAGIVGFICHYLLPHLRKEMPWLCCSHPLLASNERNLYEASDAAKIMWFERMYVWLRVFERNFIFPLVFLSGMTMSTAVLVEKFGVFSATLLIVLCSLRLLRGAFTDSPKQHLILILTYFFFKYDYSKASETFLVDYFIISILFTKLQEFMLKFQFILSYIAPWQIAWGSAFHAFAQPFSVPHSVMLFVQATVSAVFSAPLNPFLGSAIFITSYVRPIKFWERDYNTKRVDHTNTRLSSQLDRNPGADDNNLNSIFYEHLTRSLQHSLCGDLMLGRWGPVSQGDFFIMASDYLNALVHIVEVGNGLVTFQLRGLEFRGTYCQQREVEAITEGVEDDEGFCCCSPGHLPHFLSLNTAFNQRWLSWEVTVTKYILEGYSISDNSAATMLQVFELRKVLISYYVKSIIYYTVRSPHLESWLSNDTIQEALSPTVEKNYTDLDPTFSSNVDEDYDLRTSGITRSSFCRVYHQWIEYCANRRDESMESSPDSTLVSLCFSLSLLGRRVLGTASHNNASASVDFFLYGLHALFKGDFRITSSRDEWVFTDMEMLRKVVAPGVRMSLKLHQDHIANVEDFEDMSALYNAITSHEENMVISHEADPAWRNAVLHNVPSLLALRHVFDEGADEYKIIMLNKRYLSFRVIKVNRECVRGLWAGQQQELVFLRNRNPERGSIQNAKQALRNMINSSCDQPIGYPIYVSPLTTSYSSTSAQLSSVIGPEFSLKGVKNTLMNQWRRLRAHCGHNCTGSSADATVLEGACAMPSVPVAPPQSIEMSLLQFMGSRSNMTPPGGASTANKPAIMSLSSLSTVCETPLKESIMQRRVEIVDISYVYDSINLGRRIDVQWPSEEWRERGGKNGWNGWSPEKGQEGLVVHRWQPCHRDPGKRSHVDKTIVLVHIGEYYVPICEQGVNDLGAQV